MGFDRSYRGALLRVLSLDQRVEVLLREHFRIFEIQRGRFYHIATLYHVATPEY